MGNSQQTEEEREEMRKRDKRIEFRGFLKSILMQDRVEASDWYDILTEAKKAKLDWTLIEYELERQDCSIMKFAKRMVEEANESDDEEADESDDEQDTAVLVTKKRRLK